MTIKAGARENDSAIDFGERRVTVDDIQKELDKVGADAQVDNELAALKAELNSGVPEPEALAAAPAPAPAADAAPAAAPEEAAPAS